MAMNLDGKSPKEIAQEIFNFQCYWWKWELIGVKIDRPDLYDEVMAEFGRIEKESKPTQDCQRYALKSG